jgi:hypothetical protein
MTIWSDGPSDREVKQVLSPSKLKAVRRPLNTDESYEEIKADEEDDDSMSNEWAF